MSCSSPLPRACSLSVLLISRSVFFFAASMSMDRADDTLKGEMDTFLLPDFTDSRWNRWMAKSFSDWPIDSSAGVSMSCAVMAVNGRHRKAGGR